ncbi:hypothetical protein GCM10017556_06470 [Micromonospora sagamiensis]|nr:hypothetical protein GCM10017556_06470 [Micromonospora sagamiensis]
MHSAYARIGTGPSCQTAVLGLGRAAWGVSEARVTGAHATAVSRVGDIPVRCPLPADDFWFGGP